MKKPRPEDARKVRRASKHRRNGKQSSQPGKSWKAKRKKARKRKIAAASRRRNRR